MSSILTELSKTVGAETPRPFTLFLNFQPIENAPDTKGERFGEVWLFPGRPGLGACEWGYRIRGNWCTSCDMRIMDPPPTHFAYPDNTHAPKMVC